MNNLTNEEITYLTNLIRSDIRENDTVYPSDCVEWRRRLLEKVSSLNRTEPGPLESTVITDPMDDHGFHFSS